MLVKVTENVIKVVTDIPMVSLMKGYTDFTAYDEKKNPLYAIKVNLAGKGSLCVNGLVANAVEDEKAAVVIVEPLGTSFEEIKMKYGKAVVAAQKFCPIIANAAITEEELINAAFGTPAEAPVAVNETAEQ